MADMRHRLNFFPVRKTRGRDEQTSRNLRARRERQLTESSTAVSYQEHHNAAARDVFGVGQTPVDPSHAFLRFQVFTAAVV